MSLKTLGKKTAILLLLLLALVSVYIIKNDNAREKYFGYFKSIIGRADIFKSSPQEEIKIGMSDINIGNLEKGNQGTQAKPAEPERSKTVSKSTQVKEKITLESIQKEVNIIKKQVDELQKGVDQLNELAQMEKQVNDISQKVEMLTNTVGHFSGNLGSLI